jgi:hypothetical protein
MIALTAQGAGADTLETTLSTQKHALQRTTACAYKLQHHYLNKA